MSNEQIRAEFEEWWDNTTGNNGGIAYYVSISGKYCFDDIEQSWQSWQAAHDRYAGSGEAVAWQFYQDGKWHNGMETNNHKQNTIDGGFPVRDLYTHPAPAVPEKKPLPDLMMASYHEAVGWNKCVDAMLTQATK